MGSHWTGAEIKRLREVYQRIPRPNMKELQEEFPRHPYGSIVATASYRGLTKVSSEACWLRVVHEHYMRREKEFPALYCYPASIPPIQLN